MDRENGGMNGNGNGNVEMRRMWKCGLGKGYHSQMGRAALINGKGMGQ
jgi:hypothetical protein